MALSQSINVGFDRAVDQRTAKNKPGKKSATVVFLPGIAVLRIVFHYEVARMNRVILLTVVDR